MQLRHTQKTFQGDPETALDQLEADARAAADGATGGKKHKKKKTEETTAGSVLKKPSAGGVLKKPCARKVKRSEEYRAFYAATLKKHLKKKVGLAAAHDAARAACAKEFKE